MDSHGWSALKQQGLPQRSSRVGRPVLLLPPRYDLTIVKLPPPVHPELIPVSAHVPVILLLLTLPFRVNVLPPGEPERMVKPKTPVIFPLKSPPTPNDPVWVSPETKQGDDVVNVKFVTFKPLEAI